MADKTKSQRTRDDPEQSKRFLETAKEHGADETEKGADNAFKKIAGRPGETSREKGGRRKKD